uniref:G protein-coupled receptor 179 n=1 Tax=Macaca fascicularis TaxID=9541 RepID=A0A7N9IBS7_MACFA
MGTRGAVMPPTVWGLLGCCFICDWALGGPRPLRSLPPLSSQVKPGSVPMRVPPEGAEAAVTYLYSGDAQQLSQANCSERYEARGAGAMPGLPPILQGAAGTLAQAANFLNMLLQANDIRESSVEEDVEWYQALVRSMAEGDPRVYRALLTFNPPPGASHLQLALQATRTGEETILQDLSGNWVQEENPPGDLDTPALKKRVLTNDLGSLGSPKWPRADGYVGNTQQVRLSPPFLECQEERLRPGWLITLSATFYGLKPDLSPEVSCAWTIWHKHVHAWRCVPLESQGFVLGRYLCRCRPGFYGASPSEGLEESAFQTTGQFGSPEGRSGRLLRCLPCPEGCTSCMDATPCLVEEAVALRAAVLACQACCMLAIFLSMLVSYRCRRNKRIWASGVVLLETVLFGFLLLYFPVFILYFKPSVFRCIALRWVRLLGFAIVYGTIILKLYRVLQLFLSRTAQRSALLSSGRLLRRLGLLLLPVLGFLAVWTVGALERGIQHAPLVIRSHTPTGRHFYLCHHDRWDYIMVVAELLLLCWGSFLCYATRAVLSAFHEPRYMGIALHNELLLSTAFHTARFVLVPSLHPDWTLLLFFFHTHSTVTTTLALIFIPKFWKLGAPPREEMVDEVCEDELDLQHSGSYLGSSIASAWSERSLDPGDIRDELKKLYAQLEVHKTKEMAANNPHLPKKRGSSRQGLGRSFMRYLAEFPEALARQHSRDSGSPGRGSLPGSSRRRTYDQRREQDPPLLDSLLRRKLAKKASRTESRAVEGPPALGFRSASAHNLTVGERLPRARPASLQKSLSVAGSREKALLMASQAYLEETYRQAKEREERKKAEAAMASLVRRPSARRLERPRGAPLSAPPSPAKSSSMDSSHASGRLHEEAGRRLPHPPIRHQVSTPTLTLSGTCLGEPGMLSPTSTLAPALLPALAPTPVPAPAPVPVPPQSPNLLTYICPWENAELPVKKENVPQEGPSGPEQGHHSPAPARARLWRALSVAVEKSKAGENEMDAEDAHHQREANDADEDRPKIFPKSHSLKAPVQQGSMRSLGLAIKALTRSRSTYREKERVEESPKGQNSGTVGESVGAPSRSPRLGRPKAVSKQAALAPCDDEESLQNQQNAHTSRMLQVCQQEGSREQEDRGRRTSQGLGEQKAERAGKTGLAALRQVSRDKNVKQSKDAPVGWQELPKIGIQSLGSVDHRVAEVCPWEVTESETRQPDSGNKAEICPWEMSEGAPESRALRQDPGDSQEKSGEARGKSEPTDVVPMMRKKPDRLVREQEAVCPWESADQGGLCPGSAPQDPGRIRDKSEVGGSVEARKVEKPGWEAAGSEAHTSDIAKAELCPWEASEGGEDGKPALEVVKDLPQEKQKTRKATFWKEQKPGGDLESLCPWESTDFRGPSAVSIQAPGSSECSGSLGSGIAEVCPWEAGDAPAIRKAEICPWELDDNVMGQEMLSLGTGGESLQKEKASRKGSFGEMGEHTVKAVQKLSQQQESVCPRESTVPGPSSPCLDNSSSKAGGQFLRNGGSRATQVCPQEDLRPEAQEATPAKAEICPWEVNERTREEWTSAQAPRRGDSQKDKEKMPGKSEIKDVTAWEKPEGQIQKQEAVSPWESVNPGSFSPQPHPQDTERPQTLLQISGSVGSKAADICSLDVEETLTAGKAEICPWEVGAGAGEERALGAEAIRVSPNDTGKVFADLGPRETAVTVPEKPQKPTPEWDVACPWGSVGPDTLDADGPKAGFQELDHMGCRPGEVCPWEAQEAATSEKAKMCPWEVNEGTTGKGLDQETGSESAEQREKALEKGRLTSLGEDASKRMAKLCQEQEAICLWENKNLRESPAQAPKISDLPSSMRSEVAEGHSLEATEKADLRQDPKVGSFPEHITQEKAPAPNTEEFTTEDGEKTSHELQSVYTWVTTAPAVSFSHPNRQRPDQPKASSQRLVSTGGRAADVCPWDVPDAGVYKPDRSAKAETCPWEVTERIPVKGVSRQDGKGDSQEEKGRAPEKSEPKGVPVQKKPEMADFRQQEAVCPWESQHGKDLSPQPAPDASDSNRGSSEAAGSVETRVVEVCLWEVEEAPSAKKAEISPWEVGGGAAEERELERESQGQGEMFLQKAGPGGTEEHFSKAAAKPREQEVVCLGEGTGSGGLLPQSGALDPELKVSPEGAGSMGSRMAELCQWEITDPEGNKIKGTMADICPGEETGVPPEESGLLALTATQREFFPTAPEKPLCLLVHGPLDHFFPESKIPCPKVSRPASTFTLEGVRELQGPSGLEPRTSLAPEPSLQEAEAQSSSLTEDSGQVAFEAQYEEFTPPTVYPWDWE